MKLHKGAFALSAAIVSAICYTIKAGILGFAKDLASRIFSTVFFIKDSSWVAQVTHVNLMQYLVGLAIVAVSMYIAGWVFAWIYNRLIDAMYHKDHIDRDLDKRIYRD